MSGTFGQTRISEVSDYWNRRPCNIRHSPKEVGTREYFDEVEARKYFVEPHIPHFAEFERWRGKKVLEIGCGIGTDTVNFARHGADVTAIDISDKSLAVATQRVAIYGLQDRVRFFQGNAETLSTIAPPSTFDLIYSFGVIHHSPHPEQIVSQLPAYLGPQSELRVMVYAKCSYKLFWIMKERGIWDLGRNDELIAGNSEAEPACPVTHSYTFDGARRLLAPFEIMEMRKAHIFTWEINAYKEFQYKKDAAWADVSDALLAELEKELGWRSLLEIGEIARVKFPEGCIMRISVIGLGKLGAPWAAVLASKGHIVVGVDTNTQYVDAINRGKTPVSETGLDQLIEASRQNISATTDICQAVLDTQATFIVVSTPSEPNGGFSLQYVLAALEPLGAALKAKTGYHLVVLTSTVMPGDVEAYVRPALEKSSGRRIGENLGLCYNPEFIALGSVIHDMLFPDFLLIGESDARAGDMLAEIHRTVCGGKPSMARMNFVNAEITKLAVNTFVTTKISCTPTCWPECASAFPALTPTP